MDISDTLAPKTDQLDADDLIDGPRIFTIERVTRNNAEQPINVHLKEFPRPWRPGTNMRRVLGHCWGKESSQWTGLKIELYRDPNVTFGKETTGGIRIKRMGGIKGQMKAPIIVSRGKRGTYPVQPLPEAAPAPDYTAHIAAATTKDDLNTLWQNASAAGHLTEDLKAAFIARAGELGEN